jgi:uncharacterized protein (DUF1697 family)
MPELRTALTESGFDDVRTYIQSGNVVVDSPADSAEDVADAIRNVLSRRFDLDVPEFVRTPEQLRQLSTWCPFREDAEDRPTAVHLLHLAAQPDPELAVDVTQRDWSPDEVAIRGADVAIKYASTMHRSRLQHGAVLRRLGVDGTARNWRTLQALIDLTSDN